MNNQQQGDYQALTNNGAFSQKRFPGSHTAETQSEIHEEGHESLLPSEAYQAQGILEAGQGSIAYELLLLQQRLAAYEQLHIEEMAELRQEIERLRRAFLQGTNAQLRALSPARRLQAQTEKDAD